MMWPKEVREIKYFCGADGTLQPALIYGSSDSKKAKPLLVGLHTWSFDYKQAGGETVYARWCIQNEWLFIHPNFRGPNNTSFAMGSEYVVSDIMDAVEFMKGHYSVDTERIYLVGVSGGGHAALLMAGRVPDLWAGISAWCGISDIKEWYKQTVDKYPNYAHDIKAVCGGDPVHDTTAMMECAKRSPVTYLSNAKSVNLDINAGVKDGREGSVPFIQSLVAFNKVALEDKKIKESDIVAFYKKRLFPSGEVMEISEDLFGTHKPLFVRTSQNARIVIFDGGHDIIHLAALNWLALQRKGMNARWLIENPVDMEISSKEMKSGV